MKTLLSEDSLVFDPPELGCVLCMSGLPGSGSKIYDKSSYCNIGTITGATWKRLPSGLWYLYYTTDDVTKCGNDASLQITSNLTVLCWVNLDTTGTGIIMSKWDDVAGDNRAWVVQQINTVLRFNISDDGTWGGANRMRYETSITVGDNTWHLIGFTFATGTLKLFVDGVEDPSPNKLLDAAITAIFNTSAQLQIGAMNITSGGFLTGNVAVTRIYNRVLSPFQIQNIFQREKHLFGVW